LAKLIVAITGTPGTGKSTFAKELSRRLRSCRVIEINSVAKEHDLYLGSDMFGSKIVDLRRLNSALRSEIRETDKDIVIIVGHLVPELHMGQEITITLREGLKELAGRLERRGYQKEKIRENLISEAVDYCGINSRERCERTYEIRGSKDRKMMISYLSRISRGMKAREPSRKEIEELGELASLIKKENRYGL
jgi:broad-specificity NMP kinase